MKRVTMFFYASDSAAAKALAKREQDALNSATLRDATTFDGYPDRTDVVVIMPDVAKHHRDKITAVYGDKVVHSYVPPDLIDKIKEKLAEPERKPLATGTASGEPGRDALTEDPIGRKVAVHRGGGRWFVMDGDTELSGPHSRAEAKALAAA